MFGSEDKFKKFNDDVASFLKKRYEEEADKNNAELTEAQLEAAKEAQKELSEAGLYTFETKNSVLKKHLLSSSKGVKVTPQMVKVFERVALGG